LIQEHERIVAERAALLKEKEASADEVKALKSQVRSLPFRDHNDG
jgi:hypothetical protein